MLENRFGMFVHWGLYSLLGVHEQVMACNDLSHEEYEALLHSFDPSEYDPEEWVLLAKRAGMSYLCFTAKHHDGFCMWDTKYTDYSIMSTPYGKDVLRMLADACRKHDVRLSLYYSNPDWHHPNAYNPLSTHQWKAIAPDASDLAVYREYIKNQLRELLSNYGEIYSFFWDIPPRYEDASMNALIRELQPNILINDRGYDAGDFSTPERSVPDGDAFEGRTEACQSVGEQSWGYRRGEDYFSARYLMSSIGKMMAMGGSYLLNVGPMPNGRIDERSRSMLERIGDWYCRMGGALESNEPEKDSVALKTKDPCVIFRKNGRTYLCFYNGLRSTAVTFKSVPSVPQGARLMNSGRALAVRYEPLPMIRGEDGRSLGKVVSLTEIPVDEYPSEPLVIEIRW